MKVKCIGNNIDSLSQNAKLYSYLKATIHLDDGILPITKDKMYSVYSLKFEKEGFVKYLICDDDFSILEYPVFYVKDFFELVDNRVSKYWLDTKEIEHYEKNFDSDKLFTFKEWNNSTLFYENLVNCSEFELNTFRKYKKLMDEESEI